MRLTACIPDETRPKIVCFPSNHCVGASVIKNCEPFVSGPELAIDNIPALCTKRVKIKIKFGKRRKRNCSFCLPSVLEIGIYFVGKSLSVNWCAASARTSGIATLNHKIAYDPMEYGVVVVTWCGTKQDYSIWNVRSKNLFELTTASEFCEISTCVRCVFPIQFDCYFTHSAKKKSREMMKHARDLKLNRLSTVVGCRNLKGQHWMQSVLLVL